MKTGESIIDDAMALAEPDRARVLDALLATLGGPSAPGVDELRTRRHELETGAIEALDGAQVIAELRRDHR